MPRKSKKFYQIAKLFWRSPPTGVYLILFILITFNLLGVVTILYWSKWLNQFFNALQEYNLSKFYNLLWQFCMIVTIYVCCFNFEFYLRGRLEIRWREWLTNYYLKQWLFSKAYYKINFLTLNDNAEQKISEDVREFVYLTITLVFDGLTAFLSIALFSQLLWKLSEIISINIFDQQITIYGYLVWSAIVYAILGSILIAYLGKPLILLNQEKRNKEADFRFGLGRIKEYNESIALYKGENLEYLAARSSFNNVISNFIATLNVQLRLRILKSGYNQVGTIFPLLIAAPQFFSHQILLGGLIQIRAAFEEIKLSLFFFINSIDNFSLLHAVTSRLYEFEETIIKSMQLNTAIQQNSEKSTTANLKLDNISVFLPDNTIIVDNLTIDLKQNDRLLIDGISGTGKTTLLKSIARIWPFAEGLISYHSHPKELFIAQKPYLPIGSLRAAICYPLEDSLNDMEIVETMKLCQIGYLANRLNIIEKWDKVLSLGEQQRVAICRVLIYKPDILFLDEATSALDHETETKIYQAIINHLPNSLIISIAHKPQVRIWHNKCLVLSTGQVTNWSINNI